MGLCTLPAGAGPAWGAPPPAALPAAPVPTARQAIALGEGRWCLAWQTHDAALVAALFAADGTEMGRGGVVLHGRRAVAAWFARLFGAVGPVQATRQTADLWQMGGTITEAGRYTLTFAPLHPGSRASVSAGSYVTVWQKQKNGQWLIHSDVAVAAR